MTNMDSEEFLDLDTGKVSLGCSRKIDNVVSGYMTVLQTILWTTIAIFVVWNSNHLFWFFVRGEYKTNRSKQTDVRVELVQSPRPPRTENEIEATRIRAQKAADTRKFREACVSFSKDVYQAFLNPTLSDQDRLRFIRTNMSGKLNDSSFLKRLIPISDDKKQLTYSPQAATPTTKQHPMQLRHSSENKSSDDDDEPSEVDDMLLL